MINWPLELVIPYKELVDRGLNTKASNLHPLIDKLLREIVSDKIKSQQPQIKFQAWHYTYIRFQDTTEKYYITVMPGEAPKKG